MINKHQFQLLAKSFRAGRLSLAQFTSQVFPVEIVENVYPKNTASQATEEDLIPKLIPRSRNSHKGDYGKVLLIGGSIRMAGAISLAGMAAMRSGAGLVKVMVPAPAQPIVAGFSPCYMTIGCESRDGYFSLESLETIRHELPWADVVVVGPGMGRGEAQQSIVKYVYEFARQRVVIDADGLNCLSDASIDLHQIAGPRILTPHEGEFDRLVQSSFTDRRLREEAAIQLAETNSIVVVLKGHHTLISDGRQTVHNETGNPGMATGGTGDVLTGMIAALMGQRLSPFDAARLGVHVHGLAGDEAARRCGEVSLIAEDLIECLGGVFQELANRSKP